MIKNFLIISLLFVCLSSNSQELIDVGYGWASNSINTVIFRKNSITSYKDTQYIAFYDTSGHMVIGKRNLNEKKLDTSANKIQG